MDANTIQHVKINTRIYMPKSDEHIRPCDLNVSHILFSAKFSILPLDTSHLNRKRMFRVMFEEIL